MAHQETGEIDRKHVADRRKGPGEHRGQIFGTSPKLPKDRHMPARTQDAAPEPSLPMTVVLGPSPIRFPVAEAAVLLRMSRAQLYNRINDGAIKPHKDGARTYITRRELQRYVDSCR